MVLERLQGTGRLTTRRRARCRSSDWSARASGIDADARRDAPFAAYGELEVQVGGYETGDVWARTMLRIDEAREAARLIRAAAGHAPAGPTRAALPPLPAGRPRLFRRGGVARPGLALGAGRRAGDARGA